MRKLLEDEGSIPEKGWIQVDCIVKRMNLATLEAADEEIDLLESHSDTCASNIETMGKPTAAVVRNAKRKTSSTNKNADLQRHNYNELVIPIIRQNTANPSLQSEQVFHQTAPYIAEVVTEQQQPFPSSSAELPVLQNASNLAALINAVAERLIVFQNETKAKLEFLVNGQKEI